jgi:antitoxin VapB
MPLYIRDDEVLALAEELQRLMDAPSKTQAVKAALRHEIARARDAKPLTERLDRARAKAAEIGTIDPSFDMKTFTDSLWEKS